jgi:hypothetical protein
MPFRFGTLISRTMTSGRSSLARVTAEHFASKGDPRAGEGEGSQAIPQADTPSVMEILKAAKKVAESVNETLPY